ncbi:hypothetical protein BDZ45DRAFT_297598 [Acephala macrosclerotiorum]|nr:hypothetical protein BDZ45DRAFT_297598 [Acephala macrosclerotiorum]
MPTRPPRELKAFLPLLLLASISSSHTHWDGILISSIQHFRHTPLGHFLNRQILCELRPTRGNVKCTRRSWDELYSL